MELNMHSNASDKLRILFRSQQSNGGKLKIIFKELFNQSLIPFMLKC